MRRAQGARSWIYRLTTGVSDTIYIHVLVILRTYVNAFCVALRGYARCNVASGEQQLALFRWLENW